MGCAASKLDNEETVRRCKERRRLIKEALHSHHHLSAAHSDYCLSLLHTGSALSIFAAGQPFSVSDNTPSILLPSLSKKHHPPPSQPQQIHIPSAPEPPPAPPPISPSISSSKLPHILSSPSHIRHKKQHLKLPDILSDSSPHCTPSKKAENNINISNSPSRIRRNKQPYKRPHILSDSSPACTPNKKHENNVTVSDTLSQTESSVWNWENFYPPSPPDSEYFQRMEYNRTSVHAGVPHRHDREFVYEEEETEREEVECSDWGYHYHVPGHYSTTSSSDVEGDDEKEERDNYDDLKSISNFGKMPNLGMVSDESVKQNESSLGGEREGKVENLPDNDGELVSMSSGYGNGKGKNDELVEDERIVVKHKDLIEIVEAIKEYFDKAAGSGEEVSKMLETGRAQLRQLKKTLYHSSGLLSNLCSTWNSKPSLAVKYRFEPSSVELAGGPKSLGSTLEHLFAWEKKLYEEVKARERVKIAHEKKLSMLQSREAKGEDEAKLDKTKTSINDLQSLILVTSQAVSTTSAAIIGLRDSELVPQLVELCHGLMYMWRSMNQFHEVQNHIVQQVIGLVNQSIKVESTSDLHRQATRDLESAVSSWHSSFCRLIKFQRDFIRSLHGWFKLSLVSITNVPNDVNRETSKEFVFFDEWKLALDRVPDTVASEAIKSFVSVVHSIGMKQTEELKLKKRTESASKGLEKKAYSLRNIEKKYYNSYSMVGLGLLDSGPNNVHALDARDPLVEKKSELVACQRRVEDEMLKHSMAVELTRAVTLNNIQTGLPGVFQALTSFSSLFMEALETVCNSSYSINR